MQCPGAGRNKNCAESSSTSQSCQRTWRAKWFVPNDDRQTITLEQVLPQNPRPEWIRFDKETAAAYSKRIGNMVLLPAKSNATLGNDDFVTKAAVFAQA
jgi:hypothetical protein